MSFRRGILVVGVSLAAAFATSATQTAPQDREEPRELGLTEHTERGLVQIDVSVRGRPEAVTALTREVFELWVGTEYIEQFTVDRLCALPDLAATTGPASEVPAPRAPTGSSANFLFYFDQAHLTMAGRQNAIDDTRRMLPELVRDGARAAIVSSATSIETFAELTADLPTLLGALDTLESDRSQWVPDVQLEDLRISEVVKRLEDEESLEGACSLAREYQRSEAFRTERALRMFSLALGRFAELGPPRVVVFFADTLRPNPGMHYYGYVGRCDREERHTMDSRLTLDAVLAQAGALGIRLYTVQAQGLVSGETLIVTGTVSPGKGGRSAESPPEARPTVNTQRIRDAQTALASLALETGGRSFQNGVAAPKIASAIRDDLGCLYLLNFDAAKFPEDTPLPVRVAIDRRDVEVSARGQIVIQSESARLVSRLLAAFATPDAVESDVTIDGRVVPAGFTNGRYRALVQIVIPPIPLPSVAWDVGVSVVARERIQADVSGRVRVAGAGVPVIYEAQIDFPAGPFELIVVAHESTSGQIGRLRVEGAWPERSDGAAVGPLAVLQPADAAFVRDGVARAQGALALGAAETARSERPTALVGLVCRGSGKQASLQVERTLVGTVEVPFEPLVVPPGDDPCVQIRDVVPPATMSGGGFRWRVSVTENDGPAVERELEFHVADETATSAARPAAEP